MATPLNPPPWPIPPSRQVTLPAGEPDAEAPSPPAPPGHAALPATMSPVTGIGPVGEWAGDGIEPEVMPRLVVVFDPEGSAPVAGVAPSPPHGVRVERRPAPGPVSTFAGVGDLARAVGEATADGAAGAVIVHPAETLAETAWALELLHEAAARIVLVAASGGPADLTDAITVAAAGPEWPGCVVVANGEIHAARHVTATGVAAPAFASPEAGPLGQVTGGTPRLLRRPPGRFTVRGPFAGRPPRVGLHVVALGDDGGLLRTLAGDCAGLVVAARAGQAALDALVPVLAETAARIPVVLHSPTTPPAGLAVTRLDPLKARVLMHLLLGSGHDRAAVLDAFAALEADAAVPPVPSSAAAAF
ncbi:hypothetical protein GCM10010151_54240 [Actinoallomurus spadix]|uniref:L-asparaginase N-terminal domain-containing protein n=1 Tax=Actinoallomurus spadix TaxID=79912 RepID=A0ABP3H0L6_9ACTN